MRWVHIQIYTEKGKYTLFYGGFGGWRCNHLCVATFICCVDRRPTSTTAVRAFHHTTVAEEKVRWWVLERDLGASRRKSLPNTVLVLRSDLLQVALRSAR